MAKKINHIGMKINPEEHDKWHQEHKTMTPQEHSIFMKKMGISEEDDEM